MLTTMNALLGEVISTQREGNAMLAVMARSVSDEEVVGPGASGVAPHSMGSLGTKKAVLAATASTRVGTRRQAFQPYTAGIEYTVDPMSGATFEDQTRSGVRSGVANWLSGRANNLADEYSLHRGERIVTKGKNKGGVEGPAGGYFMDEQGRYRHPLGTLNAEGKHIGGSFASAKDAVGMVMSEEERAGIGSKLATANTMQRMGQAWAGGQGVARSLAAALPQGALKFAGGAAIAITAADKAMEFVQGQAAANRTFQEAYGGSSGDQWGERGAQWMNRNITGRFSMLGGENYDKLFTGAMDMGLRGGRRNEYIGIGAGLMGQGVGLEQTKQLMDMSINAGLGLAGLTKAIKDVSSAARDAGINAARARDLFVKNYEASTEVMFGSQNLPVMASLLTQGQVNLGRAYQNISLAPTVSSTVLEQARATNVGMGLGQYQAAQMNAPAAAIAGGEAMLVQAVDRMGNPGGGKPMKVLVAEWMAANRPNNDYDASRDMDELGTYVLSNGYSQDWCLHMLTLYSVSGATKGTAPGWLANLWTSESPGRVAVRENAATVEAFKPKALGDVGLQTQRMTDPESRASTILGVKQSQGGLALSYLEGTLTGDFGKQIGYRGSLEGFDFKKEDMQDQKIDPILQALLNQSGVGLGKDTKVWVQTAEGMKAVPLKRALKDFPDQVGSFKFASGVNEEYVNKTVAETVGAPASTGTAASASKTIDYGQTTAEFKADEKDKKKDEDKKGGEVKLTLTAEAARILTPLLESTYYDPSAPTSGSGT